MLQLCTICLGFTAHTLALLRRRQYKSGKYFFNAVATVARSAINFKSGEHQCIFGKYFFNAAATVARSATNFKSGVAPEKYKVENRFIWC